jgi:predicted lactoylglutathione lyase
MEETMLLDHMLDHIFLPVTDVKRSENFYGAMLAPLGKAERWKFEAKAGYPNLCGFGGRQPGFWLKESTATLPALYIAFAALNKDAVDKAYKAALDNGGKDAGPPGLRVQFHPDYYAANVLDPDGYSVEINFKPWLY